MRFQVAQTYQKKLLKKFLFTYQMYIKKKYLVLYLSLLIAGCKLKDILFSVYMTQKKYLLKKYSDKHLF